jgi:hypothetical protein
LAPDFNRSWSTQFNFARTRGDEFMKSVCCFESLETQHSPELYHGYDDDYELMIPYLICTKCRAVNLQYIEENKEETVA